MPKKIPVACPYIGKEETQNVLEALEAGELSGNAGRFVRELEEGFAKFCDAQYGIAVMNGTAALHLALTALGIKAGDEVLVPALTNMATFFAVLYTGAKPIPADIEAETCNLDPNLLEEKITERTKAIIPVHLFGHPVHMGLIWNVARKYELLIIEDAAQAHGAKYGTRRVGSLGRAACFSFYGNKLLTTGEGGMVVTNDAALASRMRLLGSLAYGRGEKFMHEEVGFNYRMTNLQAAVGCAQLTRLPKTIFKKREIAREYCAAFRELPDLRLPMEGAYAKSVYWMYHIVLCGGLTGKRHAFMRMLAEKGVETRESFVPYNRQKHIVTQAFAAQHDCPVANYVGENGLYLPSGPVISDTELRYVADSVRKTVKALA